MLNSLVWVQDLGYIWISSLLQFVRVHNEPEIDPAFNPAVQMINQGPKSCKNCLLTHLTLIRAVLSLNWVVPNHFDYVLSSFAQHIDVVEDGVVQVDVLISVQEAFLPPEEQQRCPAPDGINILVREELLLDA